MGTHAFYSGLIALSAIGILAIILAAVCSRYKCRYLMYLVCTLLIFIGILCLFLAVFFSAIVPIFYFGCDFATTAFTSKEGFESTIGTNLKQSESDYITICMPGQSGDILDSEFMGDITDSMNDFRDLFSNMNDFSDTDMNDAIDEAWDANYEYIQNSASGALHDFTNNTNELILERLADISNYPGCLDAQFQADRWIPSVIEPNDISCSLGSSANQATNVECGGSPTAFETDSSGNCNQCMDSMRVLKQLYADSSSSTANMLTALNNRYNLPTTYADCTSFNGDLIEVYNNYYSVKDSVYTPVLGRAVTADNSITAYQTQISSIYGQFQSAIGLLESEMAGVVDPDYGIIAGFNCLIFGEDIALILETACNNLFITTYFLRLSLGIAGIGTFFAMCFSVCTGVRLFLHEKVTNETVDEKLKNEFEETQENINPNKMENNFMTEKPKGAGKVTYFA